MAKKEENRRSDGGLRNKKALIDCANQVTDAKSWKGGGISRKEERNRRKCKEIEITG